MNSLYTNFKIDLTTLDLGKISLLLLISGALGIILSFTYIFTHRKTPFDRSFAAILILLPVIISFIILLVSDSNSVPMAFSLAGVFTLVRFRTVVADPKDITYILASLGIGLSTAMGQILYAGLLAVVVVAILLSLHLLKFSKEHTAYYKLKVLIPENLNFTHVFDDVFSEYVSSYKLQKVKTSDFGTMFELTYLILLKDQNNQKEFIDALRVKNGNLTISLTNDYAALVADFQ